MPEKGVKAWQVVRRLLVTALVGLVIGGGIWLLSGNDSDDGGDHSASSTKPDSDSADPDPAPATRGSTGGSGPTVEGPELPASHCPADSSNCVVATGRVIYVEANDPDGDGDAHFVTVSRQSVTMAGITIFDVRADLRPDPLPGVGDLVGGAGPVYPGHAGQKQIQVEEFHVAR